MIETESQRKVFQIYRSYIDVLRESRSYSYVTSPPLVGSICGGGAMFGSLIEMIQEARIKGYEIEFAKDSTFPGMSIQQRTAARYPLNEEDEMFVRKELGM